MTGLQFISSLIHDILSWPVAFIVVAFILRNHIARIIARLTEVSYKGMGQEISLKIAELRHEVESTPLETKAPELKTNSGDHPTAGAAALPTMRSPLPYSPGDEIRNRITEASLADAKAIADISPAGAVLVAWSAMERALTGTARRLNINSSHNKVVLSSQMFNDLEKNGVLQVPLKSWIYEARLIRNRVAHGEDTNVTRADAWSYLDLIQESLSFLERASDLYILQQRAKEEREATKQAEKQG